LRLWIIIALLSGWSIAQADVNRVDLSQYEACVDDLEKSFKQSLGWVPNFIFERQYRFFLMGQGIEAHQDNLELFRRAIATQAGIDTHWLGNAEVACHQYGQNLKHQLFWFQLYLGSITASSIALLIFGLAVSLR